MNENEQQTKQEKHSSVWYDNALLWLSFLDILEATKSIKSAMFALFHFDNRIWNHFCDHFNFRKVLKFYSTIWNHVSFKTYDTSMYLFLRYMEEHCTKLLHSSNPFEE